MGKAIAIAIIAVVLGNACMSDDPALPTDENVDLSRIYGMVRDQNGVAVPAVGLTLLGPNSVEATVQSGEATGSYVFWSLLSTMGEGEYRLSMTSIPGGYSVPPTQPNPVIVQLFSVPGELRVDLLLRKD